MLLSELIKKLEDKKNQYGDVEVYVQEWNEDDLVLNKNFSVNGGVCKDKKFVVIN